MAGIENGRHADAWSERGDADGVDLVVDDVAFGLEVDRVDDLVVPVILVAVEVFGLAAVSCECSSAPSQACATRGTVLSYPSSAGTASRSAGRP